jgi:hypothetical protein
LASNLRLLGVGAAIAGEQTPASATELLELETELLKLEIEDEDEDELKEEFELKLLTLDNVLTALELFKLELTLLALLGLVLALLELISELTELSSTAILVAEPLLTTLKLDELTELLVDATDEKGKTDELLEAGVRLATDELITIADEADELIIAEELSVKGVAVSDVAPPPHAFRNVTANQPRLNLSAREYLKGCIYILPRTEQW